MAAGLLVLLDDIASLLDDVAVYSKVAAKKTASVLGDDLAVNAQQVSGAAAERELPIIWAVAKGSLLNKVILVPLALLLSALIPWSIPIVLTIGGAYLCYEGIEKLLHEWHRFQHARRNKLKKELVPTKPYSPDSEKAKIRGAIRTDFILSIEIIVIALGTLQDIGLLAQAVAVSLVAIGITIGVYSVVALIVKLDDMGFLLLKQAGEGLFWEIKQWLGRGLVVSAPKLIQLLGFVGMLAMFLVGGGILIHHWPWLHDFAEQLGASSHAFMTFFHQMAFTLFVGILLGLLTYGAVNLVSHLRSD